MSTPTTSTTPTSSAATTVTTAGAVIAVVRLAPLFRVGIRRVPPHIGPILRPAGLMIRFAIDFVGLLPQGRRLPDQILGLKAFCVGIVLKITNLFDYLFSHLGFFCRNMYLEVLEEQIQIKVWRPDN